MPSSRQAFSVHWAYLRAEASSLARMPERGEGRRRGNESKQENGMMGVGAERDCGGLWLQIRWPEWESVRAPE